MTILKILGALVALGFGLYAGFGRFRQSQEEIDRALVEDGHRRKATRHFTPLDMVSRMTGVSAHRDRRNPFRFEPEESAEEEADEAGESQSASEGQATAEERRDELAG